MYDIYHKTYMYAMHVLTVTVQEITNEELSTLRSQKISIFTYHQQQKLSGRTLS